MKIWTGLRVYFRDCDDPSLVRFILFGILVRFDWELTCGLYTYLVEEGGTFDIRGDDEDLLQDLRDRIEEFLGGYVKVKRLVKRVRD